MRYTSTLAVVMIFISVLLFSPFCSNLSSALAQETTAEAAAAIAAAEAAAAEAEAAAEAAEARAAEAEAALAAAETAAEEQAAAEEKAEADAKLAEAEAKIAELEAAAVEAEAVAEAEAIAEEEAAAAEAVAAQEAAHQAAIDALMTREDAVEKAKEQLIEPPPVFDLTNPGIVYGMLGEAVDAWKATLGGSPNEWGVDLSGDVVSSTRPDFVPAELQTFLLAFYKDSTEIGLAFGPVGIGIATAELAEAYNESVRELADKLMEEEAAAVEEGYADGGYPDDESNVNDDTSDEPDVNDSTETDPPATDNSTETSEDTPALDDNTDDNGYDSEGTAKEVDVVYFGGPT